MKKFLPLLIVMVLLVSTIGIMTASAGASISGNGTVVAGKSYTYKGTAKYSAGDIVCKIEGLGQTASGFDGATGLTNQSLSASASIKVSIPSSAKPGDKFTIKFSGEYSVMDSDGSGNSSAKSFSTSKTITVGVPKTPDPNATPKPLEGWEIVEAAADEAKEGEVIEAVMEDDYKIPESLLKQLIDNKNKLIVDFGTYKCMIDPAMLTDIKGIKSLNLELSFEKLDEVSEAAGGMDTYQLHFKHSGELPGMLKFTFKAEGNIPGDTVYLYYYYGEANVMEGKVSAVVDENGMLTFEIYHCSSYVVTSEVLPDAISNFDNKSAQELEAANASLEDAQATIEQMQGSLNEADNQIAMLDEELTAAQAKIASEEAKANEENEIDKTASGVSVVIFIISLIIAAMLSVVLTMILSKTGVFKKLGEKKA